MILSKRERTIVLLTGAVLALFLADRFFLTPVLARKARIDAESADCTLQLQKAESLFAQKKRLVPRWREMTDSGLGTGAMAAESRLLHAIRDWAQEAQLNLSSVKHERTEMEKQFQKITWRATGTGSMAAVSRFLHSIQEAALPVRIADLQIGSRQEGGDSLSIQVGVSTLCMPAKAEKEKAEREKASTPNGKVAAREEKP
jgi:type II secretory pathway component PulM